MSFQGDIPSIPLSDVIQNLAANQQTGALSIQSGQLRCQVGFRKGKIVSYADDQGSPVVDWLLEKEIVPAEAKDDLVRRYARSKRKTLGEFLADMDLMEPDVFRSLAQSVIKERLYDALALRVGTFVFRSGEPALEGEDREVEALGLELNATSILMESARRSDEWLKIRRHIPSENEIYIPADPDVDGLLEETEDEIAREALVLMDGTRTLRQVIAKLPYPRFEVSQAIAHIVAEKKVKILVGDVALQASGGHGDPIQAIGCLEAILEREPGNREILTKLAELNEATGRKDEAAKYNKLLAVSYLDAGDLPAAEERLRKSLAFNVKDHTTWQKLWDTIRHQDDKGKILEFGKQFVAHFHRLGLLEVARDRLLDLIRLFPDQLDLRVDLAETRFELGQKRTAVRDLSDLGRYFLKKKQLDKAGDVFNLILKYDRENQRVRKLCEDIRSGQLEIRRARNRKRIHTAVTAALLITLLGQLAYELHVHGQLFQATRTVFAEGLLEEGRHAEAIQHVAAVQRRYPFSLTALYKTPPLLKALRDGHEKAAHEQASQERASKDRASQGKASRGKAQQGKAR